MKFFLHKAHLFTHLEHMNAKKKKYSKVNKIDTRKVQKQTKKGVHKVEQVLALSRDLGPGVLV